MDAAGPHAAVEPPRHHVLAAVFVGGMLGTLARAALAQLISHPVGAWPWATLIVNVVACLLLGWWSTRIPLTPDVDPRWRPFLATGICGGLSTFSTLQLELVQMAEAHRWGLAAGYLVASLVAGLASIVAGRAAARAAHHDRRSR